jgi:hypothetical protein
MTLIDKNPNKKQVNFAQDLIEFSKFTVDKFPAQNYGFIFWNHGIGILDPEWNNLHNFVVNPTVLSQSQRIQIEGITKSFDSNLQRGILFDIKNRNYLKNEGLTYALSHITSRIIGKKFAVIGMDACLMSMLEVFYQIRNFSDYSVASEEVELASGWNYYPFLNSLSTNCTMNPKELAQNIVLSFEAFYKNKTKFYTQSAIDLEGIDFLKQNLDQIIANFLLCCKINSSKMKRCVKNARKSCFELSIPFYIDLHSFYSELKKQICSIDIKEKNKNTQLTNSQAYKDLKDSISLGIELIDNTVISNVTSIYLSRAKGISIYFPKKYIDPSYLKTHFAQESLWLNFLKKIIF